jgi:Ankyrin repeats (3 copies)
MVNVPCLELQLGANAKHIPPDGVTILHTAALGGSWEMCMELMSLGCDLRGSSCTGLTALHCAAAGGASRGVSVVMRFAKLLVL